jgi:glycosyltransferase involved in cell wall biosynthesis
MKIAYLLPGTGVSGGIAVVCQHANRLRDRGHDVLLATEDPNRSIGWFPGLNVPVVGVNEVPTDLDVLVATGWSTVFRLASMPARHRFYFVQSDETRFHPPDSAWKHITRLTYTLDFNYLTEARWIQRWLRESFGHDAELVPNGLDELIFFRDQPLVPRGDRPRVLLEGAIGLPYKGMAEAFQAVADEDVEVWCVSSLGRPRRGWRCDRFFEQVPMKDMRRVYSSCDILLKLSRVEGFFGPPMEMMACGGAVIVGRVTGYDEYIEDGVNALVVDPRRADEATAALRRLLSDEPLRRSLIDAGLRTARAWRWEPSIDVLERYYLDVVEGRRGIEHSQAAADRAFSVAFFYGLLRGEVLREPDGGRDRAAEPGERERRDAVRAAAVLSAGAIASMQTDPVEKLIERLRFQRWFRASARGIYASYRWAKGTRQRVRALVRRGR